MTDKIFDDFMRDKLRNNSSPVPDGLWKKIEKETSRKPVGFFWSNRLNLIGVLILLITAIGGFMWWQANTNNGNKSEIANDQPIVNSNKVIESAKKSNEEHLEKIDFVEANSTSISTKKEETKNNNNIEIAAKISSTNKLIKENIGETNAVNDELKKVGTYKTAFSTNQKMNTKQGNNLLNNKPISNKPLSSTDDRNLDVNITYPNNVSIFSKGNLVPINTNLNFLSMQQIPSLQKMQFVGLNDCPSVDGNTRNDWYMEFYASPDYNIKTVKGNAANSAYLKKKDSTESMKIGYTVGGRITKNFGEHFMLKAGLQFSQINERFTLRSENERRITTVITIKTVTDASGNVTTVNDTSTLIQIGYAVKTSNNTYRNIELPLMLGYEFGNTKWQASVNAGAIVNMVSWYKGTTLDTSYQAVSVSQKTNGNMYQRNIGISLYGSISIIKPITERVSVFAEPYFRYSLSNLNANALGYNQRFSAIGLSLGLRHKFNGKRQH